MCLPPHPPETPLKEYKRYKLTETERMRGDFNKILIADSLNYFSRLGKAEA